MFQLIYVIFVSIEVFPVVKDGIFVLYVAFQELHVVFEALHIVSGSICNITCCSR